MYRIRDRYQGYETGGKKQVKNGYKDKEEGSTKKPIKMTEKDEPVFREGIETQTQQKDLWTHYGEGEGGTN